MESRTLDVDGVPIRWEERGEGPPLVLVHGIPTTPRLWRHVAPRIERARVIAWEMTGYGGSIAAGRGRDLSVAAQAARLLAWLDAMGIERAVLGGHDLGAGVVQIAAVRRPRACAGLFITNGIGYDSWPIPSVRAMRASAAAVERLPDAVFRRVHAAFLRRGHDDAERAAESHAEHWPFYARAGGARAFAAQLRALDVRDTLAVADDLPKLDAPARLVWGAEDRFQKLRYGERFARDLRAPLRRIEGARHFTPEDHPAIVAEALNALMEEVARRESGGGDGARPGEEADPVFRRGMTLIPDMPEVMPGDAGAAVREVYEDVKATLRVPFVNLLFRLLANEPERLAAAWRFVAPLAGTAGFERAARALREAARPETGAAAPLETEARDEDAARFTEAIEYALPKLLLIATLLDPATPGGERGEVDRAALPRGAPEGMVKLGMADPDDAALAPLFDEIRRRHRHPKVATWFRALGTRPELLRALWSRVGSEIGASEFERRKAALVSRAEAAAAELRGEARAPEPSEAGAAVLAVFRRRVIPDLMLDVALARPLLDAPEAANLNRFDLSQAAGGRR
jgi:pimeloyl-ACP methyl ester carboxylesterase